MAIELQVSSVSALITGEPRERQIYRGQGDKRESAGRLTDADGRPVSGVGDATVLLPDMQAAGLTPGAIIRVEGNTVARLAGGDFAAIRATVTGERVTPVGRWQDWIAQGRPAKSGEGRAA
jgi:hypothetical protein